MQSIAWAAGAAAAIEVANHASPNETHRRFGRWAAKRLFRQNDNDALYVLYWACACAVMAVAGQGVPAMAALVVLMSAVMHDDLTRGGRPLVDVGRRARSTIVHGFAGYAAMLTLGQIFPS
jgi:hypothetical protein